MNQAPTEDKPAPTEYESLKIGECSLYIAYTREANPYRIKKIAEI